jgi:hypothetical protein
MKEPEELEFHELANEFPLLSEQELQELADDIKQHGWRTDEHIVTHEGKILDGRNRWNAAKAVGFQFAPTHFRQFDPEAEGDPVAFVISKNLHRRHLSEDQRAMIAAKLYAMLEKQPVGHPAKKESSPIS